MYNILSLIIVFCNIFYLFLYTTFTHTTYSPSSFFINSFHNKFIYTISSIVILFEWTKSLTFCIVLEPFLMVSKFFFFLFIHIIPLYFDIGISWYNDIIILALNQGFGNNPTKEFRAGVEIQCWLDNSLTPKLIYSYSIKLKIVVKK